jgi:hypothetical protein
MIVCIDARYLPALVVGILFMADVCAEVHKLPFQYMGALIMTLLRRTSRITYKGASKMRKRLSFYPSSHR